MGLFDKIKKTASGIVSNPLDPKNYLDLGLQTVTAGQVDTNGINNPLGKGGMSFSDILLGKKQKDIKPDAIADQIRATQSKGLTELNSALDTPSEGIVREGIDRQKAGILTSAQDARRKAQEMMARTGLKGSSIGLGLNRSIDQQAGDSMAALDAQTLGMIRNQKIQDATTRIGLGNINTQGMNFNTIQGQREGGVLGYASAVAPMVGSIGQAMGGYAALKKAGG